MSGLLGINRLKPMTDMMTSGSTDKLRPIEQESFQNPNFEKDHETTGVVWYTSPTVTKSLDNGECSSLDTINNNNDSTIKSQKKSGLAASDSAILICVAQPVVEDSSSIENQSLDSGVCEGASGNSVADFPVGDASSGRPPSELPKNSPEDLESHHSNEKETLLATCVQIFIPFLIAGIGTCAAGIILDYVERWTVFLEVTELFILVPTLMCLRGNLEMTLASRLSTQANLGKLDSLRDKWETSWGNLTIVMCQSTAMGVLAAVFTIVMSLNTRGFKLQYALLLGAASLLASAIPTLLLGFVTLAVVIVSHKYNINPDNVAIPIASSLGDVTTLCILAASSSYLYKIKENYAPASVIIAVFIFLIPLWAYLSYKNIYVKKVLYSGWISFIIALIITSIGGYILEKSVTKFEGFAVFQQVINGVAGNLVAVQASRISTYLHQDSEKPGARPSDDSPICVSPCSTFFGRGPHSRTACILLAMVIPGHLLFGYAVTLIQGGKTVLTPLFLPIYLASAFIQMVLLLYIAQILIQILWRLKIDPDNSAIPLLTALGDLSGMSSLTVAFYIYRGLTT